MAAVIALGGAALADVFRDDEAAGVGADQTTATAATTEARAAPELRLPDLAAPGRIVFTDARSCELRAFDIQAGRFVDLPPVATTCELSAPRARDATPRAPTKQTAYPGEQDLELERLREVVIRS